MLYLYKKQIQHTMKCFEDESHFPYWLKQNLAFSRYQKLIIWNEKWKFSKFIKHYVSSFCDDVIVKLDAKCFVGKNYPTMTQYKIVL